MLLTSFDYSVNLHYCQDSFAGISFSDELKDCSAKMSACSAMKKKPSSEEDSNCCKNKKVHIDDLDEDYTSPAVMEFVDHIYDVERSLDFSTSYGNYGKQVISYTSYRPPPPDIDIQVMYQVFLI